MWQHNDPRVATQRSSCGNTTILVWHHNESLVATQRSSCGNKTNPCGLLLNPFSHTHTKEKTQTTTNKTYHTGPKGFQKCPTTVHFCLPALILRQQVFTTNPLSRTKPLLKLRSRWRLRVRLTHVVQGVSIGKLHKALCGAPIVRFGLFL